MLAHIYESDWWWLQTWKGHRPAALPGADIRTLGELRPRWDDLDSEQRRFLDTVGEADLAHVFEGQREDVTFRRPFGMLLLHVPNHASHHRSEIVPC